MTTWHVPGPVLDRYARELPIPASTAWSVEAHLDTCAACRAELAGVVTTRNAAAAALLDRARDGLERALAAEPPPARPRALAGRWRPWLPAGRAASWLLSGVLVLAVAAVLDAVSGTGAPSLVLLLAPALPVAGVAAGWTRALDPAHELVASTPAAGLALLLRRTLVVLAVVVPCGILAGLLTGADAPAQWLLPCLALTAATLALGSFAGMARAAGIVGALWAAGVAAPTLLDGTSPAALDPAWLPAWGLAAAAAAAVIALRRGEYRRLLPN